jgi:hypothetical protein
VQPWILFATLMISVVAPAVPTGTNGAGEKRKWTVADSSPVEAEFVSIANGVVVLSYTEQVDVWVPGPSGKRVHRRVPQTQQIKVPLAALSVSDRRWVEERNPCEASLTARARPGSVGTLALTSGSYRVARVMDAGTALIECYQKNKMVWHFELHSKLVGSLQEGQNCTAISCSVVPDFERLPRRDQEQYGVDFRVERPTQTKGKAITIVSDNR